ncbi:hypothetical protein HS088_TW17G00579 [Tripterygium wilfordii]|uniref:Uncharacterized protein n=1 Tax=Tripterygium wilfordii TaxID=458696 RepID=A0A7J7CG67_TRIWF|nr:hypothetical protein HS088_TW17G00579 [Tripterygium wilfordii]
MKESCHCFKTFPLLIVVDGSDNKKKGASGFQIRKRKLKTNLMPLAKAKATQAMEVDK